MNDLNGGAVKRYEQYDDCIAMCESADGDYVRYEDYAEIARQLAEAKSTNAQWKEAFGHQKEHTRQISERQQPVAAVPDEVMRALDRMCTPLDPSVLSGATAQADTNSMKVIRDYVLSAAPGKPEAKTAMPEDIEAVLACLSDDIDTMRAENEDCEIAANMQRAHDLLFTLANCPAEPAPEAQAGEVSALIERLTGPLGLSMFANSRELMAEYADQRNAAARMIESLARQIANNSQAGEDKRGGKLSREWYLRAARKESEIDADVGAGVHSSLPDALVAATARAAEAAPLYEVRMTGRFAGWLMVRHPDGQYVSAAKLTPETFAMLTAQSASAKGAS